MPHDGIVDDEMRSTAGEFNRKFPEWSTEIQAIVRPAADERVVIENRYRDKIAELQQEVEKQSQRVSDAKALREELAPANGN